MVYVEAGCRCRPLFAAESGAHGLVRAATHDPLTRGGSGSVEGVRGSAEAALRPHAGPRGHGDREGKRE